MKKIISLLAAPDPSAQSKQFPSDLRASLTDSLVVGVTALAIAISAAYILMRIGILEDQALTTVRKWPFQNERLGLVIGVIDETLLTPIVETALMLVPIRLLAKVRTPERFVPLISAILWAIVHTKGVMWGPMLTFIPFYFFTAQFLREQRYSVNRAWLTVSVSHSVYNSVLTLFQYFVFGPLTGTVSWI